MNDVAIIGAGPAGLTAAIQLIRMGLSIVVLDPEGPGGAIRYAFRVENIPGFPFGARGETVASALAETAISAGVSVLRARAERVVGNGEYYAVFTDDEEYRASFVLLATGLTDEAYPAPETAQPFMRSLSSKPPVNPGETILIIGGGDVSFDQAMKWMAAGFDTILLHRSPIPVALPRLVTEAKDAGTIVLQGGVTSWSADGNRLCAVIGCSDDLRYISTNHVLPCIGRTPSPPSIIVDGETITVDEAGADGETATKGLYMAGDLKHPLHRQVTLAMGDGMASALTIAAKCSL